MYRLPIVIAFLGIVGPAAAVKIPPCPAARYLITPNDAGLIFGDSTPKADAFGVGSSSLTIGPCGATHAKLKGTKTGTKVQATWKVCGSMKKVVAKATIDPGCATMHGTIKAKKIAPFAFTANLSSGCGDGLVDPGLGEECEDGATCPSGTCTNCQCAPPTTTTTTTTPTTTTGPTSSSSTTTPTTLGTTTTQPTGLCGNGNVDPGESCDDGASNGAVTNGIPDPCPAGCVIQTCTPVGGSARTATVSFTPQAGEQVAGITVLVDYPEGQVVIPGSGNDASVTGSISKLPFGRFSGPNDVDYALLEAVVGANAITPGRLFVITFEDCQGAAAPTPVDFTCTVIDASSPTASLDPHTITCSVAMP